MNIFTTLASEIYIVIVTAIITVIIQYLLNRRALFTYHVSHERIGISADDPIYGSVKMTWNDSPVQRLYLSTVELTNQSMKDFDSVKIRVYTSDTSLLTQSAKIVGTPDGIDYTDEYEKKIAVPNAGEATQDQVEAYHSGRDYFVPTMNRGQKLRFQFLNGAHLEKYPNIWLNVTHKGVVCKYKPLGDQVLGVSQSKATWAGIVIGLVIVVFMLIYIKNIFLASIFSFFIGGFVLALGAYIIKVIRKIYDWMVG